MKKHRKPPIDKIMKHVNDHSLTPSTKQMEQLQKVADHFDELLGYGIQEQLILKNVWKMVESGCDTYYVQRIRRNSKFGKAVTLNKLCILYGRIRISNVGAIPKQTIHYQHI